MKKRIFLKILMPFRLKMIYPLFKNKEFTLLDVGCGNHSPSDTKHWFPKVSYYGLDKGIYNNNEEDLKAMKKLYKIDIENINSLKVLRDNFFDCIILSHIIEHLENGEEVIKYLISKLKNQGVIYIEFPSPRSIKFPSMKGTLNFYDDKSHKRIYHLADIIQLLKAHNVQPIKFGIRRDFWRIILIPLKIIYEKFKWGFISGGLFWDLFGFAEFVTAKKEEKSNENRY